MSPPTEEAEPDYEALGYRETELVMATDLQGSAELADTFMWAVVNSADVRIIDNRSPKIMVDD